MMNTVTGQQQILTSAFICSWHFAGDCFHRLFQYAAGSLAKVVGEGCCCTVPGWVEESERNQYKYLQNMCLRYCFVG